MLYLFFRRILLSTCLLVGHALACYSQDSQTVRISFAPVFGAKAIVADESYGTAAGHDSLTIETLRFYISGISFCLGETTVYTEPASYHLVDIAEPASGTIALTMPAGVRFDHLRFSLGIDSATNTSGALGGDLDPTRGMYWSWQSGYINFKLEGKSEHCPARNHLFEFHLGGYRSPYYALQAVTLPVSSTGAVQVALPVDRFLETIDLRQQYAIMIPGAEAVTLSRRLAQLFYIIQP